VKNRTNCVLLAVFFLSFVLWAGLFLHYLQVIDLDLPLWLDARRGKIALYNCAIPAFCLQLFLCRATQHRWLPALLTFLVGTATLFAVRQCLVSSNWDSLGWAVIMISLFLQSGGCALAWGVYGLSRKRRDLRAPDEATFHAPAQSPLSQSQKFHLPDQSQESPDQPPTVPAE
jgi:hypothetical protein